MYAFIDESGDHNLNLALSDNTYNVFVMGTVLIEKNAHEALEKEFRAFKKSFFGGEDFILHTKELTHPTAKSSDPRNGIMRVPEKRAEFYKWINSFIERAPFSAYFTIIRKDKFLMKYVTPFDSYELSFENALNRTLYYGKGNEIEIYSECRDVQLDKHLKGEYAKLCIAGTRFHSSEEIKKRIKKFDCVDKKENIAGLQIADLLANPVGRHFLGIRPKPPGNEVTYEVVRRKLAGTERICLAVFP